MCGNRSPATAIFLVAVCLLFLNASHASAQAGAVIRGQIVAEADNSVVTGASVTLTHVASGRSMTAAVDENGRYALHDVTPGEYVVTTSAAGFSSRDSRLFLEPREVRSLTVTLEVARVAVSVEVSAESPMESTHSPSSTVLTLQRLEEIPVAQHHSLPDTIVALAPGMIRGHDDFVHVRGHEIALNPLINGVSFWENPHTLFSGGVSAEIIETANVMTGGFPAEYGNRFGGVVDIVTKSGFSIRESGTLTLSGGGAGRRSASGEIGGSRNRFAHYVFGSFFASDRFLSPPDPVAHHDSGLGGRGFARLDGNLGQAGLLRVMFMGDGANFEIPRTPTDVVQRPLAQVEQRTRQQTSIVGWSRGSSDTLFSGSVYQRWSHSRLLPAAGPLTARAGVERELMTVGGKLDVSRSIDRHALKGGIDLVRLQPQEGLAYDYAGYREFTHLVGLPHIHIHGDTIAFQGDASGGQVSGYVQDSIQLGSRITADVGLRVDRYDLVVAATHVSPRVNLAIRTGGAAVLHASYNRFFVPPPVEGLLSGSAGLTRSIREIGVGLAALSPTVEDQVELGITAPVRPLRVGLTGYFRATDDPVHTTIWPDSRIYSYAAFDRGRAYGMELKVDAPSLARYGITAYANYALGRVYFYNPVTAGFVTEAAHVNETNRFLGPMDQTHTATGGLTYHHASTGAFIGTAVEYGSGTPIGHGADGHEHAAGEDDHAHTGPGDSALRVPSHFTGNVTLGFDLLRDGNRRARLSLRIDVENVGNRVYRIAQESQFSPTQFSVPRLISASAKLRF